MSERINVMITGGASTVGRHLLHRLYHDPRVGHVLAVGARRAPSAFAAYHEDRFTYRRANILKYRQLKDLLRSRRVRALGLGAVVHLDFVNMPQTSERWAHRVNVEGTKRLLDECIECRSVSKFIFKSSDIVYKLRASGPVYLDENAELNFDTDADPWIKDRVDADMICRAKMDAPNLDVVVLRFAPIIGGSKERRWNSYFGSRLQLRAMGFNPLVNLIHISDVVQALQLALFRNGVRGVFNIAGGDTAPISALGEAAGGRIIPVPAPALFPINWALRRLGASYYFPVDRQRIRYSGLMDISKARRVLGYEPSRFVGE